MLSRQWLALFSLFLLLGCGESQLKLNPSAGSPAGTDDQVAGPTGPIDDGPRQVPDDPIADAPVADGEPEVTLELTLSAHPVLVAESVAIDSAVLEDGVDTSDNWDIVVSVSPTTGVIENGRLFSFSELGEYRITAQASDGERTAHAELDVTVVPGRPATLTIEASSNAVPAGHLVTFDLTAADIRGNVLDPSSLGLDVWVTPGDLAVDSPADGIVITTPGAYEVHAGFGAEVTARDLFSVTAGTAESIILTTEGPVDLNPGSSVMYDVEVLDAYGNALASPDVTVTTDPSAGTLVDAFQIQFVEEGTYTVHASVDDTPLSDSAGPFVVDGAGPVIELKAPDRGTFQSTDTVAVYATVTDRVTGVDVVEFNGEPISLDRGGNLSVEMDAEPGVNLIVIDAWDTEGHHSRSVNSFLYGEAWSTPGDAITNSLMARANQQTIDTLEDVAEDAVSVSAIRSAVVGMRLVSECITIVPGTPWTDPVRACVYVDTHSLSSDGLRVQLTPRSGRLDLRASLDDVRVSVRVHGTPPTAYPFVEASEARVTGRATVSVNSSGVMTVNLTNVGVSMIGFDMGLGGWPDWANEIITIGGLLDDVVRPMIEDALKAEVVAQAPAAINDMLDELEIATTLNLLGTRVGVEAIPQQVPIDSDGLTVIFKTVVEANNPLPEFDGPGSMRSYSPVPVIGSDSGFGLSVSDDFLNQILYSIWEGGLITNVVDDYADDMDLSALTLLVPEAEGFEFELDPLLPPVFRPRTSWLSRQPLVITRAEDFVFIPPVLNNRNGELQMGDILIDLYATYPDLEREVVARIAVSVFADTLVGIDNDDTVSFELIGDPEFYFDGVYSLIPDLSDDDIATILEALLPMLLPDVLDQVQRFPLPAFEGFGIGDPQVEVGGSESDYLIIRGDLESR